MQEGTDMVTTYELQRISGPDGSAHEREKDVRIAKHKRGTRLLLMHQNSSMLNVNICFNPR